MCQLVGRRSGGNAAGRGAQFRRIAVHQEVPAAANRHRHPPQRDRFPQRVVSRLPAGCGDQHWGGRECNRVRKANKFVNFVSDSVFNLGIWCRNLFC